MAACEYSAFDEMELAMFRLWDEAKGDRLKLIAYQAMVKAVRVFKAIIKGQDYK